MYSYFFKRTLKNIASYVSKYLAKGLGTIVLILMSLSVLADGESVNNDMIIFGNTNSESSHNLTTGFVPVVAKVEPIPSESSSSIASDIFTGALGQTVRRLLPRRPTGDYYGGEVVFTMSVDPIRENNFTLKMWGSDIESKTWLVLEVEGFEVGARHHMKDESILQNSNGWLSNRFIYRTVRLPKHLTAHKTSVKVRIRSIGWISYYASPPYDNFQKRMMTPSVGLYRAYSHVESQPDITGEAQGKAPQLVAGVTSTEEEVAWLNAFKSQVNSMITKRLASQTATLSADDMDFLAQAYSVSWTPAAANSLVPNRIVESFDTMVKAYSAAPNTYLEQKFADRGGNGGWGGYFGQVGRAITLLWPLLESRMNETVDYGGSLQQKTRREAWATALRASVDYGRTHRRTIGNQVTDSAQRTYWANAGLLKINSNQALLENEARRYLYEAYGLMPWMGDDKLSDGPVPARGNAPYGPNWYMLTSRGTTKEDCLVGGDYGEMGAQAFRLGLQIQDATLTMQGVKMLRARAALRYPTSDEMGKLISTVANPIGCRNDHQINRHKAYLALNFDTVLVASAGEQIIGADLLGYAQQQLDEGQLLWQMLPATAAQLRGSAGWDAIVSVPDAYETFRSLPPTKKVLPMSSGQPDFAWVDEENMVVAAKHGEERFFANMYWRGPDGINSLARVFVTSPENGYLADVSVDDVEFKPSGRTITLSKLVNGTPVSGGFAPPDNPINANVGLQRVQALRPDLSAPPTINRDAGRGTAYTLRYGNWLVAINAHPTQSYAVKLPSNFGFGKDIVTGLLKSGPLVLEPKRGAVFFLPDVKPKAKLPTNSINCANEKGVCVLPEGITATVWYGAKESWIANKGVTGRVACNNNVFGDPIKGILKSCKYLAESGSTTNQKPNVAITEPNVNKTLTQGDIFTVTASASDNDGVISRVDILYNGENIIKSLKTLPYTYSGPTAKTPVGTYSITARAYDDKGAFTTSAPINITIATSKTNKPPVVTISEPMNDVTLKQGEAYNIVVTASDSDGSIVGVELAHSGSEVLGTLSKVPYVFKGSTANVPVGRYTITARCLDSSGAVTTSAPVTINIVSPN